MQADDILDDYDFSDGTLPAFPEEGEIVAKYFSLMEANVSAALLRSEGIHCFLANVNSANINPHLQNIIHVHVHPLQAARAREILQELAVDTIRVPDSKQQFGFWVIVALIIGLTLSALLAQSRMLHF